MTGVKLLSGEEEHVQFHAAFSCKNPASNPELVLDWPGTWHAPFAKKQTESTIESTRGVRLEPL